MSCQCRPCDLFGRAQKRFIEKPILRIFCCPTILIRLFTFRDPFLICPKGRATSSTISFTPYLSSSSFVGDSPISSLHFSTTPGSPFEKVSRSVAPLYFLRFFFCIVISPFFFVHLICAIGPRCLVKERAVLPQHLAPWVAARLSVVSLDALMANGVNNVRNHQFPVHRLSPTALDCLDPSRSSDSSSFGGSFDP